MTTANKPKTRFAIKLGRDVNHILRKKVLEKGDKLTLQLLLSTAANHERVQSQLENMEGRKDVNSVLNKQQDKEKESAKRACYRCGKGGLY